MSYKYKHTVYIPCHNYSNNLIAAMKTITEQVRLGYNDVVNSFFDNNEVILINDGSSDSSLSIIRHFERRLKNITVLNNKDSNGLIKCCNKALEIAQGQYITRLDPDDMFSRYHFLMVDSYLDSDSDIALLYTGYEHMDKFGNIFEFKGKEIGEPYHGACCAVKTQSLKDIGGYDEKYSCQDGYYLWLNFKKKYKIKYATDCTWYYRIHGKSMSDKTQKILDTRALILKDFIKKHGYNPHES